MADDLKEKLKQALIEYADPRPSSNSTRLPSSPQTWGTAELIETNAGGAYDPQIAVDSAGTATAVWHQSDDGGRTNIWANRFE